MAKILTPHPAFESWFAAYYDRVGAWLGDCSIGRPATLILNLPYLLRFSLDLLAEEKAPAALKASLLPTVDYVLRGMDYLPLSEMAIPSLLKDAEKLAHALAPHLADLEEWEYLWTGYESLAEMVLGILGERELVPACIISPEHHFLALR